MNDTALSSGVVPPTGEPLADQRFELELPSGARAQVLRHGKGRHLVRAERMCPPGTNIGSMTWTLAVIAVKAMVDGKSLTLEDVEDLPDLDVLALTAAVLGKEPSAPGTLPSSG